MGNIEVRLQIFKDTASFCLVSLSSGFAFALPTGVLSIQD